MGDVNFSVHTKELVKLGGEWERVLVLLFAFLSFVGWLFLFYIYFLT